MPLTREEQAIVDYTKAAGNLRLVVGAIVAIVLSVVISYTLMRDNVIAGCWRDDIRTQAIARALDNSGNQEQARQLRKAAIVRDCRDAYPSLIPFTK